MLTPDELEKLGYSLEEIYARMSDEAVLIVTSIIPELSLTEATALLAGIMAYRMSVEPALQKMIESYQGEIQKAIEKGITEALTQSDARDVAILEEALGGSIDNVLDLRNNQINATIQGVSEIVRRDNVLIAEGQKQNYIKGVSKACFEVQSGAKSQKEAIKDLTIYLAQNNLSYITYRNTKTGRVTVKNHADVVAARHLRTQVNQSAGKLSLNRTLASGENLVEVSSHTGARPSHAAWQGKVYSINGSTPEYPNFAESTGYYGTGPYGKLGDRLHGVNCKHYFVPYIEGAPRIFEPDPKHPSGKTNDEIYELSQKQRYLERKVREKKREQMALEAIGADPLEVQKAKNNVREAQKKVREHIKENAEVLRRDYGREKIFEQPKITSNTHEVSITNKKMKISDIDARVDRKYFESTEFRKKFNKNKHRLNVDDKTITEVYKAAKASATHRSGSLNEDMYLISFADGKVKGKQTSGNLNLQVSYNKSLANAIQNNPEYSLIAIHNHPNNALPTASDFISALQKKYAFGIVQCHNGNTYYYKPIHDIIETGLISVRVAKYTKYPYNLSDTEARIRALDELKKQGYLDWGEL